MRVGRVISAIAAFCAFAVLAEARERDTTVVKQSNRNVMLNAESGSAPRIINVGLPESSSGAIVFVDGTKAAQGIPRSYFHWAGGNSYRKVGSIPLIESIIRTGEHSSPVNSWTKLGGESFEGLVTARSSTNGLIRLDAWLGGPVKGLKGWYYSTGAYVNYDPTAVNSPTCPFLDRKQIYQLNLSKRWKSSELDLLYRFSWCGDQVEGLYNTAPFIYNGDGSVTEMGKFRMGYDLYFPIDDKVDYMDLRSGKMKRLSLSQYNDRRIHDLSILWKHRSRSDWDLKATLHLVIMPRLNQVKANLSGTDYVEASRGFTLPDGTPYEGYIQNRLAQMEHYETNDAELLLQAEKKWKRNELSSGISLIFADQYEAVSSMTIAHTAVASPERILLNGQNAWRFNCNALYFDAIKFNESIYIFDKFFISDNFSMLTGLRAKPVQNRIHTAARMNGESKNRRVDGFNLADPNLADIHPVTLNGLDYAFSESFNWRFAKGFQAIAEGFFSMTNKTTTYFKGASVPSLKPIGNAQGRAGLTYVNSWLSVAGIISYITSWKNASTITVTKVVGGISETIPWVAQYGIGTKGATIDGNIFSGGFNCHLLFTWQDPRYHNYTNVFTFSDGSTQTIDYTDKQVTGISKVMIELDPSYRWKQWRIWLSGRYFSRRYASRTNFAYFKGRVETFGGLDWEWRKDCKVSLSFVNLLGQGGVKGTIDIADTIDDASALAGYVMAGTFIRPFSVDLSVTYKF